MRRPLVWCSMAMLLPCSVQGQTRPLVDHHQHLFSPATVKLVAPQPLPAIELPPELDALLRARSRDAQDATALRDLYTEDAWLSPLPPQGWIRGRDAIIQWWIRSKRAPFRLTPVGWSGSNSVGHVTASIIEGSGDSSRHVGNVLLSVRKGSDAGWRIGAEALTPVAPPVTSISAKDLVALLDEAGIRRALVLSMGYTWGSPNRTVENEYEKVKAENDWTSQQVAQYPDRLRAFCSFNPIRAYALEELARCAKDRQLHFGLKLHFANSVVDLHNAEHIEQLRRVFRAANGYRMPIVIHLRSSLSRGLPYGGNEARLFLNEVLPAAPDIPVQIAHLAGAGGYDDPTTDEALGVFIDAVSKRMPIAKNLYFEMSGAVGLGLELSVEKARLIATRIRQLGVQRILFGSDAATAGNLPPRLAWVAFQQVPLTDAEFKTIAENVAPYMREGHVTQR